MQQAKSFFKELIEIAILSLVIVLPIRYFLAQPFLVSGASMDNTFHNGNYLIVNEISYRFEEPQRGDVIIFRVPPKGLEFQHVDKSKTVFYIKRIIGLPGEKVNVNGDKITIYKTATSTSGTTLVEPYAHIDTAPSSFTTIKETVTLGKDEYFVVGDNRHNSSDSRLWGTLPRQNIRGKVFMRLFPITELSLFTGDYNNYGI